jgi:NlpC/P60 family protein
MDQLLRAEAAKLVGTSHDVMDCWALAAHLYAQRGLTLDENWMSNLVGNKRHFDTALAGDYSVMIASGFQPRPWDMIVIRNHVFLPNHVGVMIDGDSFIHSLEGVGACIQRLDSADYRKPRRVLGVLRLRESK